MKIAFAKGRGAKDCMDCMEHSGACLPNAFRSGKSVACILPELNAECFLVRGSDIAWYLSNNIVDVAIGSRLLFLDADNPGLHWVEGFPIAECRLSLLARESLDSKSAITVATRYPDIGRRLLANSAWNIKWVQLTGCLETAMLLDVCDAIIDVVETGWSMREYQLHEVKVLASLQHGIWVNTNSTVDEEVLKYIFFGRTPESTLEEYRYGVV